MPLDYLEVDKLDDEAEEFVRRNWQLIDGEDDGMANSKSVGVVVRDGHAVVGALKGWSAAGVGYVSELMVDPDRRDAGIGAELLRRFESNCAAAGTYRLALHVEESSSARRFYEREGWEVELTVVDWLGGHTYLQMRKDLPH